MDALADDDLRTGATDDAMFGKARSLISERAPWLRKRIGE